MGIFGVSKQTADVVWAFFFWWKGNLDMTNFQDRISERRNQAIDLLLISSPSQTNYADQYLDLLYLTAGPLIQ